MITEEKRIKSLNNSLRDGICASITDGLTSNYLIPLALALKATTIQIGYLSAFPLLIGSLLRFKTADFASFVKNRPKTIAFFVCFLATIHFLIGLIPFIFYKHPIIFLIAFISCMASTEAFAGPIWASLMGDLIRPEKRGYYLGWRNRILGFVNVIFSFIGGLILYISGKKVFWGYLILFFLAGIFRFFSGYFISRMDDCEIQIKKEHYFSYWMFIKRLKESNFAKFTVLIALLSFSTNIAAPFFTVYMLRDLKFSYLTYTILVTVATISGLLSLTYWGKFGDRLGNVRVMKISSFFIPILPIMWLIWNNPFYIGIIQILGTYFWTGFNLATGNFIYDVSSSEKRARCIAYFTATNGIAGFLGAFIAGYLAKWLPGFYGNKLLTLFLLSGILRLIVLSLGLPNIKEVRKVEHMEEGEFLYNVLGVRSAVNFLRNIVVKG